MSDLTKEIIYEKVPEIAKMEDGGSITISGYKFNQMQDAMFKIAFMEKVMASKVTVLEKTPSNWSRDAIIYVAVGPDELAQRLAEESQKNEKLFTEVQNLKEDNLQLGRNCKSLAETRDKLREEKNTLSFQKEKLLKRGFFSRLFNLQSYA